MRLLRPHKDHRDKSDGFMRFPFSAGFGLYLLRTLGNLKGGGWDMAFPFLLLQRTVLFARRRMG
jgi:hypothetical protein